ncbi:hypothetical protein LEMLEM_LOCUS16011 [Lemmus lemmus]
MLWGSLGLHVSVIDLPAYTAVHGLLPSQVPCTCSARRGQKRASDPLKLDLQILLKIMWMLRIQPGSSGRASSALNH